MLTKEKYTQYVKILHEELVPAMGCTEPIAIAYASAKARKVLNDVPMSALVEVSGNIVKNAKSVTVPHTGGKRGIKYAFIAGLVAGNPDAELEVISGATEEQIARMPEVKRQLDIEVVTPDDARIFDIRITLRSKDHEAYVRIADTHTNIVCIKKDGETLYENLPTDEGKGDRTALSVEDIISFADEVELSDIAQPLERQIEYNMAIAEEGMKNNYGACIGKVIYKNGN